MDKDGDNERRNETGAGMNTSRAVEFPIAARTKFLESRLIQSPRDL